MAIRFTHGYDLLHKLGSMFGGYIGALLLLNKTVLPYWLPTHLHVRFSLFIKVTPAEA